MFAKNSYLISIKRRMRMKKFFLLLHGQKKRSAMQGKESALMTE